MRKKNLRNYWGRGCLGATYRLGWPWVPQKYFFPKFEICHVVGLDDLYIVRKNHLDRMSGTPGTWKTILKKIIFSKNFMNFRLYQNPNGESKWANIVALFVFHIGLSIPIRGEKIRVGHFRWLVDLTWNGRYEYLLVKTFIQSFFFYECGDEKQ